MSPLRAAGGATTMALGGLALLHAAWAAGSSFPLGDRSDLADVVAGRDDMPGAVPALIVAGLLASAALLVVDAVPVPREARRVGVLGAAAVLGTRGVAGVSGRTHRLVPWRPSERFVRLDRVVYGPLCLALASGTLGSLRR